MEPFPSLLTVDPAEPGGRWRWGSREEHISLLHLAATSQCHQLWLHSSQRALAAQTLLLLLDEKIEGFSRLHLNIPKTMKCSNFLWERPHSFLNLWFPRESCFRWKKLISCIPLSFSYCCWIKPLIQPEALVCTCSEMKQTTDDHSKSSGRDFVHRRILRENGQMERRKRKRTVHALKTVIKVFSNLDFKVFQRVSESPY